MSNLKSLTTLVLTLVTALGLAACSNGKPTGATCPTASTLTYQSFGQGFMHNYCTDCHSSTAENRHGAPKSVNFDTVEQIRQRADDIDQLAGSGPDATNDVMPETDSTHMAPTQTEREQLAQWLACGAP